MDIQVVGQRRWLVPYTVFAKFSHPILRVDSSLIR